MISQRAALQGRDCEAPMAGLDINPGVQAEARPRSRAGRIVFWVLVGLAAAAVIISFAIPILTIQPYLEQSTSMQPTLAPGDRIFAATGSGVRPGDIVVLRVPARISGTADLFVKRVIGVAGDHVACCNAQGRITVNGRPLHETYLYPGNRPSLTSFSVTLRKGQIWVMGDHRNISVDSRKWGPVPADGVVGQVLFVAHGATISALRTPQTFVSDGLAPADARPNLYVALALQAAAAVAALLLLTAFGTTRCAVRRRRARRAAAGPLVQPLFGVYRGPPDPPGSAGEA
jgi:signal peptidase I